MPDPQRTTLVGAALLVLLSPVPGAAQIVASKDDYVQLAACAGLTEGMQESVKRLDRGASPELTGELTGLRAQIQIRQDRLAALVRSIQADAKAAHRSYPDGRAENTRGMSRYVTQKTKQTAETIGPFIESKLAEFDQYCAPVMDRLSPIAP
jgi:hypothetical protein